MLTSDYGIEQIARVLFEHGDPDGGCWPPLLFEAHKAAEGRACMRECPPHHLTLVIPMWREADRLRPPHVAAGGQDALREKARQLDWLVAGCEGVTWDVILVDDGCDRGSGEAARRLISQYSVELGDRFKVHFLRDGIAKRVAPVARLHSAQGSSRGGAVAYGLALALSATSQHGSAGMAHSQRRPRLILTTAADTQIGLAAAGSLCHRILVGGAGMAVGVRYGTPRSVLVKPFYEGGDVSGGCDQSKRRLAARVAPFPSSHLEQHSNLQITVRHHIRSVLLPAIAPLCDIHCGFVALREATVRAALPRITRFGKAFDSELLLLCLVDVRRVRCRLADEHGPAAMRECPRVPTGWIDSDVSTVPMLFVEDSPVSNADYDATLRRGQGEFLQQLEDQAALHRELTQAREVGESSLAEQHRVLKFVEALTLDGYGRLLEEIRRRRGPAPLPLFNSLTTSELLDMAEFEALACTTAKL
jgi:hypothetical protein